METGLSLSSQIVAALLETDGSKEAAGRVLEEKLGAGLAQGLEVLSAYATSDDGDMTATEAEMGALMVARQVVRPIFEQKLQKRVDAVDGAKKKSAALNARALRSRKGAERGSGRAC